VVYGWVMAQGTGSNLISLAPADLIRFGGNYPPATLAGGWWRLSTYMLLHGGLWHIGFNLLALNMVGPMTRRSTGAAACC